jgi:peptide/nickel transport system substrate-binding protein
LLFWLQKKTKQFWLSSLQWLKKLKRSAGDGHEEDVNQKILSKLNPKKIPSWSQLKQLPKIINKQEKIKLAAALAIFVFSFLGLAINQYMKNSIVVPDKGGTYTEGLIGVPNLINPILATSDVDRDLVRLLFSGLMKYDEAGNLVPDLANNYTIDAEQKIYTFELRPNIYWHNEEPITADDIIFTIERIKNPEYKSPYKNSFNGVTVNRINDQTVQFVLTQPFAPFLSILTVGILPEHLWYSIPDFGAQLAELNKKPIGSGPYKFQALTKDTSGNIKNYTLEAYDQYHLNRPYIDQLIFKFYPDFEVAAAALQNKNVDGLIYLPQSHKEDIKNKDVILKNLQSPQYSAVFFNPENNSLLSDIKMREALTLAIDKQKILTEALNNDGQIIHSPILPGMLGYDETIQDVEYNPETAAAALEELGWKTTEESSFRQKDETELAIKLTTVDQGESVKTVSIIKENWEAIGIKTELEIIARNKIRQDIIEPRNYQVLVFGEIININSGPYPFWHSSQNEHPGLNLSVLANKDIDKYLENVRQANNDVEKIEPLKNFQTKLLEQHFAIFLYNPSYTYPVGRKLKGLENLNFVNLPADRFSNIHAWFLKTKRQLSN